MTSYLPLKGRLRGTPLRIKLVASVLVLVAAGLIVISAGSAIALRSYLIGQIDADLKTYANALRAATLNLPPGTSTSLGRLPTDYMIVYTDDVGGVQEPLYDTERLGLNDLPPLPDNAADFDRHQGDVVTDRARDGTIRWRIYYTKLPNGQLLAVGLNLRDVDKAVSQLVWIDILVGGAVLLLLASLGAAIVRTSLKPLVEIGRASCRERVSCCV